MALEYSTLPINVGADDPIRGRLRFSVRREAWWWQPGPLDAWYCCCCCRQSLCCGVGVLAILDIASGVSFALIENGLRSLLENTGEFLDREFMEECDGVVPVTPDCEALPQAIEVYSSMADFIDSYGALLHVTEILWIATGVVGLWASFGSNALAARAYLWMWLLKCLLMQIAYICYLYLVHVITKKLDSTEPPAALTLHVSWVPAILTKTLAVLYDIYHLKVIWSYQIGLRNSNISDDGPNIELRGIALDYPEG